MRQNFKKLSLHAVIKLLVDRTDFRENIKINILHATKEELLEDFEFTEIAIRLLSARLLFRYYIYFNTKGWYDYYSNFIFFFEGPCSQ